MTKGTDTKDERLADKSKRRKGPLGDVRPEHDNPDARATGSLPPEPVENRPTVGQARPEDYPEKFRNTGGGPGGAGGD